MESTEVKEMAKNLGINLCGIVSVERFNQAPEGFRPTDVYKKCKSVIVYAKKLPKECVNASSCIPYTHVNNVLTQIVDNIGIEFSLKLEERGIGAVPIPSDDPYEYWEPDTQYGRAIFSLRHAAYLAGLGVIGKNTLLINKEYGNMIQIGAILVDVQLRQDELVDYEGCLVNCNLCIESCPQRALNGETVNQQLCRPLSNYETEKGYIIKKCNICRIICPNCFGIKEN